MNLKEVKRKTRIYDANAVWNGIKVKDMMDKSGEGIANVLIEEYGKDKSYIIVCGKGNNGGDGLVAGRYLAERGIKDVKVFLISRSSELTSEASKHHFNKLKEAENEHDNLKVHQDAYAKDLVSGDIYVECLVGTGIKGDLYKRFDDVVQSMARRDAQKVAIDLPAPGYTYDLVISMHFQKVEGAKVVDIGIPSKLENMVGPGEVRELSIPDKDAYKTKTGEVFVFGGSHTFHGAPMMAIKALSKFVGSVYFYTTPGNRDLVKNIKEEVYEFITVNDDQIEKYAGYADVLLIGPGLEDNLINRSIIQSLFEKYPDKKKVIDAYAIAMAPKDKLQNTILTPHRGELRHIWGDKTQYKSKRLEGNVRRFAKESGARVVLKGHKDLIFDNNGEVMINKTGNAGMAKGGTGDVMSGVIAAFASTNNMSLAMKAATFINGYAGDLAYEEYGYNFSATDIVPFLQKAVKNCNDLEISS
jgi:NAD(P)H-hydrate epimerase